MLFTDASADPRSRIGFGAYLLVRDEELFVKEEAMALVSLKAKVATRCFENTSSTTLELQVLIWALSDPQILAGEEKLTIYTDSQNVIGLSARRDRLEKNGYYSGNNRRLSNHHLYQQFFNLTDQLNCRLIKVSGHQPNAKKNHMDQLFTLVDRASRSALRKFKHASSRPGT